VSRLSHRQHFQLTCPAQLEALGRFRDFIQAACDQAGLERETCDDLKLAVDEACTNIITHGYAGLEPGSISLELWLDPQQALVKITDFGHPFEPGRSPAPDVDAPLEARAPGGFGLFFIYSVMDEVAYQTSAEGNCLTLSKRIATAAGC
jgi:serine/threonine-protein kinase RsbW